MKYVIGLTGNIGSGKSTVLEMLERLGAKIVDADAVVHEVMATGTPVWQAIVDTFGEDVLDEQLAIDRRRLASLVFEDPDALRRLEDIVHPATRERFMEIVKSSSEDVVAVEAVKLIESGVHKELDSLWLVTCPAEERLRRLVETRGANRADIEDRLRAQMTEEQQAQWADVVIDNSGSLEHTWEQVKTEWDRSRKQHATDSSCAPGIAG